MRWRIFVFLFIFYVSLVYFQKYILLINGQANVLRFYWSSKSSELNLKIPHHQLSRGKGSKIDDQVETGEG